jgi:hypothetical protein
MELSEYVRLYARALSITNDNTPFEHPVSDRPEGESEAEFGVVLTKAEKKRQRETWGKKAKVKKKKTYQKPKPWLHTSAQTFSASELATLAEQAKLALAEAGRLAGERVIYCCGYIRKEKNYDCRAECSSKQRYKIIRELCNTATRDTNKQSAMV